MAVKNIILIDYENVQPEKQEMELLKGAQFEVIVFFGAGESGYDKKGVLLSARVPFKVVWTARQGRNALDMLIAYQLGLLTTRFPKAFFHIISKDGHYDSLIEYLKESGVKAGRSGSVTTLSCVERPKEKPTKAPPANGLVVGGETATASPPNAKARFERVIDWLTKRVDGRPKTRKALKGTLRSLFQNALNDVEVEKLAQGLSSRQIIKLDGEKVSYALPPPSAPTAKTAPGQKAKGQEG